MLLISAGDAGRARRWWRFVMSVSCRENWNTILCVVCATPTLDTSSVRLWSSVLHSICAHIVALLRDGHVGGTTASWHTASQRTSKVLTEPHENSSQRNQYSSRSLTQFALILGGQPAKGTWRLPLSVSCMISCDCGAVWAGLSTETQVWFGRYD